MSAERELIIQHFIDRTKAAIEKQYTVVNYDAAEMLKVLEYARRALRVERGIAEHKIMVYFNDDRWLAQRHSCMVDGEFRPWRCEFGADPFAAVEALLDKLEETKCPT